MNESFRVAIADDSAAFRHQLKVMLQALGHEVVFEAETGRELVDHCLLSLPDVIISDIRMPGMDGLEAAHTLHLLSSVPIILISASCDRDLILRTEQTQVLTYLVKPLTQANLETALGMISQRNRWPGAADNTAIPGHEGAHEPDGTIEIVRRIEAATVPRSPVETGRIPRNTAGIGNY